MNIDTAIRIAVSAHRGQTRQNGEPYIFHCMRVMLSLRGDRDAEIAGILHDVLEDTHLTELDFIRHDIAPHILEALKLLTRTNEENHEEYLEYVRRIAENPLARKVKLADLADNMDLDDIPEPIRDYDLERYRKYREARQILREAEASGTHATGA